MLPIPLIAAFMAINVLASSQSKSPKAENGSKNQFQSRVPKYFEEGRGVVEYHSLLKAVTSVLLPIESNINDRVQTLLDENSILRSKLLKEMSIPLLSTIFQSSSGIPSKKVESIEPITGSTVLINPVKPHDQPVDPRNELVAKRHILITESIKEPFKPVIEPFINPVKPIDEPRISATQSAQSESAKLFWSGLSHEDFVLDVATLKNSNIFSPTVVDCIETFDAWNSPIISFRKTSSAERLVTYGMPAILQVGLAFLGITASDILTLNGVFTKAQVHLLPLIQSNDVNTDALTKKLGQEVALMQASFLDSFRIFPLMKIFQRAIFTWIYAWTSAALVSVDFPESSSPNDSVDVIFKKHFEQCEKSLLSILQLPKEKEITMMAKGAIINYIIANSFIFIALWKQDIICCLHSHHEKVLKAMQGFLSKAIGILNDLEESKSKRNHAKRSARTDKKMEERKVQSEFPIQVATIVENQNKEQTNDPAKDENHCATFNGSRKIQVEDTHNWLPFPIRMAFSRNCDFMSIFSPMAVSKLNLGFSKMLQNTVKLPKLDPMPVDWAASYNEAINSMKADSRRNQAASDLIGKVDSYMKKYLEIYRNLFRTPYFPIQEFVNQEFDGSIDSDASFCKLAKYYQMLMTLQRERVECAITGIGPILEASTIVMISEPNRLWQLHSNAARTFEICMNTELSITGHISALKFYLFSFPRVKIDVLLDKVFPSYSSIQGNLQPATHYPSNPHLLLKMLAQSTADSGIPYLFDLVLSYHRISEDKVKKINAIFAKEQKLLAAKLPNSFDRKKLKWIGPEPMHKFEDIQIASSVLGDSSSPISSLNNGLNAWLRGWFASGWIGVPLTRYNSFKTLTFTPQNVISATFEATKAHIEVILKEFSTKSSEELCIQYKEAIKLVATGCIELAGLIFYTPYFRGQGPQAIAARAEQIKVFHNELSELVKMTSAINKK